MRVGAPSPAASSPSSPPGVPWSAPALSFAGGVPRGAGLSSSAALEVALCLALLALAGVEAPDRLELANLARGSRATGSAPRPGCSTSSPPVRPRGHALRIDFAPLAIEPVPFDLRGWQLVTLDSGAAPRPRRIRLQRAPRRVRRGRAVLGVEHLAAPARRRRAPARAAGRRRARHVMSENRRVDTRTPAAATTTIPARRSVRARGPGRANLIGEHTDYNGGLALPFPISHGVTVTAEALTTATRWWRCAIDRRGDGFDARRAALTPTAGAHSGAGGGRAAGRRVVFAPPRFDRRRPAAWGRPVVQRRAGGRARLALLPSPATRARSRRAGQLARASKELGRRRDRPADQLAALLGEAGQRCGSTSHARVRAGPARARRLGLASWTPARRSRGQRARATTRGARVPGRARPARPGWLSDADPRRRRPGSPSTPGRHVPTENDRVDATVAALERGDLEEVGRLLDASHASLRDDYDASVPEVERRGRLKPPGPPARGWSAAASAAPCSRCYRRGHRAARGRARRSPRDVLPASVLS